MTEKQQAISELDKLQMKTGGLAQYMARFRSLACKAGYNLSDEQTTGWYARSLIKPVLTGILSYRKDAPTALDEWITEVNAQEQCYATLLNFTSPTPWMRWTPPTRKPIHKGHTNGTPMDVDLIRKANTPEEKITHRKEGCCFKCSSQGHMARDCPCKKKQKPFRPKGDPLEEPLWSASLKELLCKITPEEDTNESDNTSQEDKDKELELQEELSI
jgi:hypothetical protein